MPTAVRSRIAVFGSTNLDESMRVRSLPRPGETVVAVASSTGPGGKGANQAVAAARAGVDVVLLSAVGSDPAGAALLEALATCGVDTGRVLIADAVLTGRAHIAVDHAGENSIVVASGANAAVTAEYAAQVSDAIAAARVLVVQGEVAEEATGAAIRTARDNGTRVVANLAPYFDLGPLAATADPIVVNALEASQLVGVPISDGASVRANAARIAAICDAVVVTLGPAGAVLCRRGEVTEFPARVPSEVVDTTGAGDAFVGVLAAALACGLGLDEACASAVDAATRTVEASGAATAYPVFELPAVAAEAIA